MRLLVFVGLVFLTFIRDQSLEGKFADQEFCRLLVATNFLQSYGTRPSTLWFFHSSSAWGKLPGSLRSQLFTRCFPSSGFPGGLLGTSHNVFNFSNISFRSELSKYL